MSSNCIQCVKNKRTGPDLLCDRCRKIRELASKERPPICKKCLVHHYSWEQCY